MSKLKGTINTLGPKIDERLNGKLYISTTMPIPENIRILMSESFWAVAEQLENDKRLNMIRKINCIITPDGNFTIIRDNEQIAYYIPSLIIYPVQNWINNHYGDIYILLFITEELCHHFWDIEDEVDVNYKVFDVIKRIKPDIAMSDLYNTQWMEENKR